MCHHGMSINKAVDSSLELRSKKALIETFIAGINDVDDVMIEWREFVATKHRNITIIEPYLSLFIKILNNKLK